VVEVQGVDYIRVPVQDIGEAKRFYGEILALPPGPTQHDDWVEYQAGNVTLAVMTPETHDDVFAPLTPGSFALRVPDVAAAKAQLESAGVQVNDVWDSGVCRGAGFADPAGNRILLHHRYVPHARGLDGPRQGAESPAPPATGAES
jgi:predicted enzyme related to lactoylglutathione lyase